MANWKKIGAGVGVVVVVAVVGAGIWTWKTLDTSRSDAADDQTKLADFTSDDQDAIKRGEYVMRLADCAACHKGNFAGGYEIETPFGKLLTSNITPDTDTGIGNMTERDFFNAVRQGIGSHGLLYPAMPYPSYTKLTDEDMHDLWAYMSTIEPVKQDIDENGQMPFPFNVRLAMAGWNLLFFDNEGFQSASDQSDEWNRGKYIVDGPAHCSTCHSPRNALGGEVGGGYMSGGSLGAWYAPDITSNPHTGIGDWSKDELADYLKSGSNGTAVAAGPMAEAIEHSTHYFTDEDLQAIGTYMQSVPASDGKPREPMTMDDAVKKSAALDYEVNCSACHGLKGEGISGMVPAFAGNGGLLADDATNLIHAMLKGARAPHTEVRQTAAGMPSFAWKMDDQEIADVLNYVRNSWGNGAQEITADRVGELRTQ
ncbi:cytochrome c, partial [Salinicola rhizosphaerae]